MQARGAAAGVELLGEPGAEIRSSRDICLLARAWHTRCPLPTTTAFCGHGCVVIECRHCRLQSISCTRLQLCEQNLLLQV